MKKRVPYVSLSKKIKELQQQLNRIRRKYRMSMYARSVSSRSSLDSSGSCSSSGISTPSPPPGRRETGATAKKILPSSRHTKSILLPSTSAGLATATATTSEIKPAKSISKSKSGMKPAPIKPNQTKAKPPRKRLNLPDPPKIDKPGKAEKKKKKAANKKRSTKI